MPITNVISGISKNLFDANTILKADDDNTPTALSVVASRIVARAAAGGIDALTVAQMKTLLAYLHGDLGSVTANQHHAQAHTLTSHSTKAHSELTGIGASDHHAKTTSFADITDRAGASKLNWGLNKLLQGAGAGVNPTEIDPGAAITSGNYTGNSSANRAIPHGLGVAPKIVFIINTQATFYHYRIQSGYANVIYIGFSGSAAVVAGALGVTAMDATNFYVGNASDYRQSANQLNDVCYWVAIG